jgi:hypothetical protein
MPHAGLMPRRARHRRLLAGVTALVAAFGASTSAPVRAAGPVPVRVPVPVAAGATAPAAASGYWMVGTDGKVYRFGAASDFGSPALPPGAKATHIEPARGGGYYVLDDRGEVFAFGPAASLGNAALAPGETAVSLSATPTGQGYWIFTSAGRVVTLGDARNLGDMAGHHLNAPVVSSTVTPDGSGYWMVAADGGVFSFGAPFWGSTGNLKLNKPVEGIVPTVTDKGYWLVASDGGVFAFGDAGFRGSMGATRLNKPVVGLVRYGDGYLMVASDGGIFDFSNLPFQGSLGANPPANPIVGTAALPGAAAGAAPATPGAPTPAPGGATTPTTTPVNVPPGAFPLNFSSTALTSYGSALDPTATYGTTHPEPFAQMVDSVVEIGDKVYVAGEFNNMVDPSNAEAPASPALPYLAVLDKATWKPDPTSPFNTAAVQPDGAVMSLAASPDGKTLYAGGQFQHIGGGSSSRVAALDTVTGQLQSGWSSPQPNAAVNSVVVSPDGQHLYIGGSFSYLGPGATPATYLAELDAAAGNQIPAFGSLTDYGGYFSGHGGARVEPPTPVHASVHTLDLSRDRSTLIVGGDFLHFGVQSDPTKNHAGLLTVDATTGQLTPVQPINTRPVFQITNGVVDQATYYVAAGGGGGNIEQFKVGGTAPDWKVEVDGDATGVAATANAVYLVGHFGHVAASAKDVCTVPTNPNQPVSCKFINNNRTNHLAAFSLDGKLLGNFTAQANTPKGPEFAYLGAQDLYVGGDFTGVASAPNPSGGVAVYHKQPGLAVYHACPTTAAC